jgi:CRISPR/Cas system-associated protein endoribonuclease Cas2
MLNAPNTSKTRRRLGRTLVLAASIMAMLLLVGCGGTKVYNNDKTVIYNGAIYNLSATKQINSKTSGKLSDSNTVDLKGVTKKQFEAYLKEYGSIYVRMAFVLDDQEMLYRASSVDSWKDFQKMQKSFESASGQISTLMANKKKSQLKLR